MTNTTVNRVIMLCIIIAMISLTALFLTQKAGASAPSGLPSTFATSSTVLVGPYRPNVASTTMVVFGNSTNCASRMITTYGSDVILLFSNTLISSTTVNPSAVAGHLQLASTTVVYDSGQYGCGYVSGYGLASTTITTTEFR